MPESRAATGLAAPEDHPYILMPIQAELPWLDVMIISPRIDWLSRACRSKTALVSVPKIEFLQPCTGIAYFGFLLPALLRDRKR